MADIIGRIMRQRAQSERVFVQILRLRDLIQNEIAAADIMHQVAEQMAAERVITHVLNNGAAIGIRVRFAQIVVGSVREIVAAESA